MIDPESLFFRGAVKVINELYQVEDSDALESCLKRHCDLAPILLEVHHFGRRFFNFGIPYEISVDEIRDVIQVRLGIPERIPIESADKRLEDLINTLISVPRPDQLRVDLGWAYRVDPAVD